MAAGNAKRRQAGDCLGRIRIEAVRGFATDPNFGYHLCSLERSHWGVHICWCGVAFNDAGGILHASSLQRHLGDTSDPAAQQRPSW
jgi:hypothetical protein